MGQWVFTQQAPKNNKPISLHPTRPIVRYALVKISPFATAPPITPLDYNSVSICCCSLYAYFGMLFFEHGSYKSPFTAPFTRREWGHA